MRFTWLVLLSCVSLATTAGCFSEAPSETDETLESNVSSSSSASAIGYVIDDVPGRQTGPHCTGTLVAPRVVITAAHCILSPEEVSFMYGQDAGKYRVAFGIGKVRDAKRVRAAKVIVHPSYDPAHQHPTDLAYLVLERDVTELTPAKLVVHNERCDYEAVGYGPQTRTSEVTDEQSRASVCAKAGFDNHGFIQTVARQGTVCFGFGGGPLTAPGEKEIMGVLSWGEAWCAESTQRANFFAPFQHPENVDFVREAMNAK